MLSVLAMSREPRCGLCLLMLLAGACELDLSRIPTDVRGPGADASVVEIGGAVAGPVQVTGCAGRVCPTGDGVPAACCTGPGDLSALTAREVDRCGVILDLDDSIAGPECWQRDQAGVLDGECPDVVVAGREEPGCCTERGDCGTFSVSDALGCHHNAGVDQRCGVEVPGSDVLCGLTGEFAARVDLDVTWGGTQAGLASLIDPGRGVVRAYFEVVIDELLPERELGGSVRFCGLELPTLVSSTLCESYQLQFPPDLWDRTEPPAMVSLRGRAQCNSPDCIVAIDPATFMLGVALESPDAPWPALAEELTCVAGSGTACFTDLEQDGNPGLTMWALTSGEAAPVPGCDWTTYTGLPLSVSPAAIFDGVRRADRAFVGLRVSLGGSVKLAPDCDGGDGTGLATLLQLRTAGCQVEVGTADFGEPAAEQNGPCTADESRFLDLALPGYEILMPDESPAPELGLRNAEPSAGPALLFRPMGDAGDTSCIDIRRRFDEP